MDSDIVTDITRYSIEDILSIFNIVDPTTANVTDAANSLIALMKREDNTELMDFFIEARDKVLDYLNEENAQEVDDTIEALWKANALDKKSDLPGSVNYFDDQSHIVAENKQAAAGGKNAGPVISTHILNIDSQYRTNVMPYSTNPLSNSYNTSFIFNLSAPITKAISMRLYSYQIPTSWYAFNSQSGNTFFLYNGVIIQIPDGNYTPITLRDAINAQAALRVETQSLSVSYDDAAQRFSFTNNDLLSTSVTIIFFIQSNVVNFTNCGSFVVSNFQTLGINKTLGWLLGFRPNANTTTGDVELILLPGAANTQIANVPPNTYGPKYFVLSVEEYTNRRLTRGMYNITNTKQNAKISIPDFYKTTRVACKLREGSLTQAEQYSINSIISSSSVNNNVTGFRNTISGPSAPAALALIPLSNISALRPDPYIKFGADLTANIRNYSAPIVLNRLSVRLTDDNGALVNLYDNDWSFSVIIEEKLN